MNLIKSIINCLKFKSKDSYILPVNEYTKEMIKDFNLVGYKFEGDFIKVNFESKIYTYKV